MVLSEAREKARKNLRLGLSGTSRDSVDQRRKLLKE